MGTDERTPREATIEAGEWWSRELRQAVKGLARHCCAKDDRPVLGYACRHTYDGRDWLVATDAYRALFVADRLDISALDDCGLTGIHRSALHAAAKHKLYDGPVTVPVADVPSGGAPNVVACIPTVAGTIVMERVPGSNEALMILADHDGAGYQRSPWKVRHIDGAPGFPLAVKPEHLNDAADALNTNRLIVGFADRYGPPVLVKDAEPPTRATGVDGFALVMPVRLS